MSTALKPWRCPDCTLEVKFEPGVEYLHDPGCPTAKSDDEMMADDRAWFDAHPELDERKRPLRRNEVSELNAVQGLPIGTQWAGRVTVHRGPFDGVRWRTFENCYAVVDLAG